jgi:rRNA-processing protein CGR1
MQVEREQAEAAMRDGEDEPALGQLKRPKMNTVGVGKSSGRGSWKQPAQRANSVKNSTLSSTWEKKMKIKAERDSYQSRKKEVAEVRREAAKEEKARRSEVRRKKEENRAKSVVTTKISAATARRMAKNKKLKKKLVMVDG